MLDARRLEVLAAVAARGSMTAAAQELAYTPSAVSQQLATLEREAGTALLVRHPRGVRLTEAGAALVGHALAIREHLGRAEADLAALRGARAGRLRLASFTSAGTYLLPGAVARFRSRHPGVALSWDVREPDESAALLRAGELDLAVVFDYVPDHETDALDVADLHRWALLDDPMTVALPADHPEAATDGTLEIARLHEEAWIGNPGTRCAAALARLAAGAGFVPRVALQNDDYPTVSRLVASGVGVALVPTMVAGQMGPGVVLRPVAPELVRRLFLLSPAPPSPAAAAAAALIVDGVRSDSSTTRPVPGTMLTP